MKGYTIVRIINITTLIAISIILITLMPSGWIATVTILFCYIYGTASYIEGNLRTWDTVNKYLDD